MNGADDRPQDLRRGKAEHHGALAARLKTAWKRWETRSAILQAAPALRAKMPLRDNYLSLEIWSKAVATRLLPARCAVLLIAANHYLRGEQELRRLRQLVDPNKTSVDVGAHHGAYAYFLARLSRWVYCYEPYPKDAEFLRGAFAGRNVTVYPFALSARTGTDELKVPSGPLGETGGQASLLPPRARPKQLRRMVVPTKRLDEMGHTDVGFVKIDVEGYERCVLAGAARLLEKERPIVLVELHGYGEQDPILLFREIQAPDYRGWFYDSCRPVELRHFSVGLHAKLEEAGARGRCYRKNFLFVPNERTSRVMWA